MTKIDCTEFEQDVITDENYFCYGYDTPEQIKQCLECEKEQCNNCLYYVNRV